MAAKFADRGASPTEWLYPFSLMRLEVVAFDEDQALATGSSPTNPPDAGGSRLGTGLVCSWRRERGLPAVTADRAWAELDVGVEVRVIRE